MSAHRLPLPEGALAIEQARERGQKPAGSVIVSYVGHTPWDVPHVFCKSGCRYRWGWSEELPIVVVTAPGIDAGDAIRGCYWPTSTQEFTTLIDIERRHVAFIVRMLPKPVLWQLMDVSEYFPGEPA